MEPLYYDAAGHIDYPTLKARATQLRQDAADVFWSELRAKGARVLARLHVGHAARMPVARVLHR